MHEITEVKNKSKNKSLAPITIDNGQEIQVGQKIWIYPFDNKSGGKILETEVVAISEGYIGGSWSIIEFLNPKSYTGKSKIWESSHKSKFYSTLEAAQEARKFDKSQPPWIKHGKLYISTTDVLVKYLEHHTGISKDDMMACKSASSLHISWLANGKFHKITFPASTIYRNIKITKLDELVSQIKATLGPVQ